MSWLSRDSTWCFTHLIIINKLVFRLNKEFLFCDVHWHQTLLHHNTAETNKCPSGLSKNPWSLRPCQHADCKSPRTFGKETLQRLHGTVPLWCPSAGQLIRQMLDRCWWRELKWDQDVADVAGFLVYTSSRSCCSIVDYKDIKDKKRDRLEWASCSGVKKSEDYELWIHNYWWLWNLDMARSPLAPWRHGNECRVRFPGQTIQNSLGVLAISVSSRYSRFLPQSKD